MLMSEAKGQQEPSMEEILASIRRIIAEDGESAPAAADAPAQEAAPEPEPMDEPAHEDVLELTEIVPDEPAPIEVKPIFSAPPPEPEHEPEPRPAPRRMIDPVVIEDNDRLVSAEPAALSSAAFASITNRLRERRGGETFLGNGAITLEELVRDMLRPMLREWLDDNLPTLVERLVREEIERIARDAL
jgi:cell pole-organizing protein PopZ